jgi:hypothetical protein
MSFVNSLAESSDPLERLLPVVSQSAQSSGSDEAASVTASEQPPDQGFRCRYIRIANHTGENLKVFLQYRTLTDENAWKWFPTSQLGKAGETLTFDIASGMIMDLMDQDWRINASQVRVWAVSETGKKWLDFQNADLVLVPERDAAGEPFYLAPEMQTYLFTFSN